MTALAIRRGDRRVSLKIFVATTVVAWLVLYHLVDPLVLGRSDVLAGALSFVLVSFAVRWRRMLTLPALVILGDISYCLYLTHQNLGYVWMFAARSWGVSPLVSQIVAVAGATVLAAALTYLVDRPLRRFLSRKLLPTSPASTVGAPLAVTALVP